MSNARNLSFLTDFISSTGTLGQGSGMLNFKGAWSSATAYVPNDIVSWTNGYYICLIAHTNVDPYTGSNRGSSPEWQLFISQNLTWRGAWSSSQPRYYVNDVVTYNNNTYVCTLAHVGSIAYPPTYANWWSAVATSPTDNLSAFLLMGA